MRVECYTMEQCRYEVACVSKEDAPLLKDRWIQWIQARDLEKALAQDAGSPGQEGGGP